MIYQANHLERFHRLTWIDWSVFKIGLYKTKSENLTFLPIFQSLESMDFGELRIYEESTEVDHFSRQTWKPVNGRFGC